MKKAEAKKIIKNEHLISYSFFESRNDASDEMVIKKLSGKYIVYATNERASKISDGEKIFDNEEDALDNFIRRLRALNNYRNSI
ncbi:MAG: Imm59 family immunity protein [Clostridia bacterium]|nr:Imm59 family immunity protein [Clostridia bacterium]